MTKQEFDKTQFSKGMMVRFEGEEHELIGIWFDEYLLGIQSENPLNGLLWLDCSHFEVIEPGVLCNFEGVCAYKSDGRCTLSIGTCDFKL